MSFEFKNVKSLLPPGIALLPGETIEFIDKTNAIKLSKETSDGFIECGGYDGEFCDQKDIVNEVRITIIMLFYIYVN